MSEEETTKTAYHEAGHAVISTLMGGSVLSISLIPEASEDSPRHGEVTIQWSARSSPESRILSVLAGPVAEMIYSGDPFHPGFVAEWKDDWEHAWTLAAKRFPDVQKRLRYLEETTRGLLQRMKSDDCWAAIAAVADLLLAHDVVENEELVAEVEQWIERW